jgi:tetratricopeptide (TPR) repeat protein
VLRFRHHHIRLDGVLGEGNVAHTAMSGTATTTATTAEETSPGEESVQAAVWRLRSRACWAHAAALLPRDTPDGALERAALLGERCLYTEQGWEDAEDALRAAEASAGTAEERGAAACERGFLAYAATLHGVRDRADEARAALGRAAALIPPGTPRRALLDFRRGLVAQNLAQAPQAARAAYRRAHAGATAHPDPLLLSFTWRHLATLALAEGDVAEARHGFAESLRLREEIGYLVGTAPALLSLAGTEPEPRARRLRAEARRLHRLLGGVPTWLSPHLEPDDAERDAAERDAAGTSDEPLAADGTA